VQHPVPGPDHPDVERGANAISPGEPEAEAAGAARAVTRTIASTAITTARQSAKRAPLVPVTKRIDASGNLLGRVSIDKGRAHADRPSIGFRSV
jgi:hypothetical protein